ncbi:MAG TPA: sugar kinase [Polyangiales bacterium]|nr:sugar kinase [Polyangiales bacterium]
MTSLSLKAAAACRFDAVSLGEVMLRFDPGELRIHTARTFAVYEGGGEYNVARGLRRCFGLRTAIVTALADNPVGRLVEDLMLQGGVDLSLVRWMPYDGAGREVRNGLNFVERGFGARAALGCSDRGHTAIAQLQPGEIDWNALFEGGVRWFHTGGVFAALSDSTPAVAREALQAAEQHGTCVSYDLNYRESLWRNAGGSARAQQVNGSLLAHVDVLFGNEADFSAALGCSAEGSDRRGLLRAVAKEYPRLRTLVLRVSGSGHGRGWSALAYSDGEFYEAAPRDVEILDRIGGGDSFASGFVYGMLNDKGPAWALECGLAHGALAMSTPGDTSMASLTEVLRAMSGAGVRIDR